MLKELGDIAVKLSRNPLGVVSFMFVFLYAFATFVAISDKLETDDRSRLVWMLVIMPFLLASGFYRLITKYHNKLYAPSDFTDESHFIQLATESRDAKSLQKEEERDQPSRSAMEWKVLNTLWVHQINLDPLMEQVWTFRLFSPAPEFLKYHAAVNRLMGEGFINETQNSQVHLTTKGYDFCKTHYKEMPPEKWWPEKTIDEEKLKSALSTPSGVRRQNG